MISKIYLTLFSIIFAGFTSMYIYIHSCEIYKKSDHISRVVKSTNFFSLSLSSGYNENRLIQKEQLQDNPYPFVQKLDYKGFVYDK